MNKNNNSKSFSDVAADTLIGSLLDAITVVLRLCSLSGGGTGAKK